MSNQTEQEQWLEIQNGNKMIFEAIFRQYYQSLCGFAYTKLSDSDLAEDIVQGVYVKLWDNRKELKLSSFKSYLFTSVNNAVINHFKHLQVRREHQAEMKVVHADGRDDDVVEFNELQSQLMQLIADLPEQRQKVFRMAKLDGMKYQQIADELGISIKTVENQMGKALVYLRENLREFFVLLPLLLNFLDKG